MQNILRGSRKRTKRGTLALIFAWGLAAAAAGQAPAAEEAAEARPLDEERSRLFEERGGAFVQAGPALTHYFDFGDPAARSTLVFLHGFCGTGLEAAAIAAPFVEAGYRVVAPDWPGAGLSEALPACTMANLVAWLDAFGGELGLGRFALAGHSLGGFLAAAYAADHPDSVEALVLLDPAGFKEEFGDRVRALASSRFFVDAAAFLYIPWYYELFQYGSVFEDRERAPEEILAFAAASLATRAGREGVKTIAGGIIAREPDLDDLAAVEAPVLLVWGKEDRVLPYQHWTKFIAALPAGALLRSLEDCGHAPHLEKPAETAEIMLDFLLGGS
ncbi:MAG: alpha/beta fold hydrolase [Spirochaetaceae bacterium]|nr:alpha/beta fold hydrolase [Spirochaetaceae bacterium]